MKKGQIFSFRSDDLEGPRERVERRELLDSDYQLLQGVVAFVIPVLRGPSIEIRIVGSPVLSAKEYELERLRCSSCGAVLTAPLPADAPLEKYDPRAKVSLAVLKYGYGMPFFRLGQLQGHLGVPPPPGAQWQLVEEVANAVFPVYRTLKQMAIPAAPLDNNPSEQSLKLPILNRKNSYFFKTQNGAGVGSVLMSLIKTAIEAEANPVEYLVTLLEHAREVRKEPHLWLPWNYTGQRAAA